MSTRLWTTVTAAVAGALAAGALLAVTSGGGGEAVPQASAQAGFQVTPAQLRTNQRISQASVRRGNRALNYLAPIRTTQTDAADDGRRGVRPLGQIPGAGQGWTTGQIADGAITGPKVADGAITGPKVADGAVTGPKIANGAVSTPKLEHPTLSAVVTAAGVLNRGVGAVSAQENAPSAFEVVFDRDVSQCTYVASTGDPDVTEVIGFASAVRRGGNPQAVFVRTIAEDGTATSLPFHLIVAC